MGYATANIQFQCPACRNNVVLSDVHIAEVDWSYDRLSDSVSQDEIDLECPKCSEVFSAFIENSPSHCAVQLIDFPGIEVKAGVTSFSNYDENEDETG